jgi:hypothetical protein
VPGGDVTGQLHAGRGQQERRARTAGTSGEFDRERSLPRAKGHTSLPTDVEEEPTMRKYTLARLAMAAMLLLLAACEEAPASGSGAAVVDDPAAEAAAASDESEAHADAAAEEAEADTTEADPAEEEPAEQPLGTRDNPLPLGTVIELADWQLTVSDVTADATDLVMAENEFNEAPADGRRFLLFRVEASYEGDDSGDPWLDFSWATVGGGGNTYGGGSMDDYCGVIPDPLDEAGEAFPGATVEGNVCFAVPSEQLEGATIRVEDTWSFDDTRAFFAIP